MTLRKRRNKPRLQRETFLHIRGSALKPLNCCQEASPPAFLLPTLISSYVGASLEDLYLPMNLLAYERCGSDVLAEYQRRGPQEAGQASTPAQQACTSAFPGWLSTVRHAGVF